MQLSTVRKLKKILKPHNQKNIKHKGISMTIRRRQKIKKTLPSMILL